MKISVIIPAYNVEKYIAESLESVLGQTHKDIEIICVDDGSTDTTPLILEQYRQKYPDRIQIISQKNAGAPSARNSGLKIAKGEYVQFLDADDLLMSNKIEHQVRLILKENVMPDFVVGNTYWDKMDGTRIKFYTFSRDRWLNLINGSLGYTCSNLWNTESIKKINGWKENMKSSQEMDLIFRLLKSDAVLLYDSEPLTINRQRESGSISMQNKVGNLTRYLQVRIDIKNYLKMNHMLNAELSDAINGTLFISIKQLFVFDKAAAVNLFSEQISPSYIFSSANKASVIYKFLYALLGFKRTENILNLLR